MVVPMSAHTGERPSTLTGRLAAGPSELLRREVLEPQFRYEVATLLPYYVAMERVLVLEYARMGLVSDGERRALASALASVTTDTITPDADENLSDIAFALERHVAARLPAPVPAWHVDRSRNDFQSCGQLMHARDQILRIVDHLLDVGAAARGAARRTAHLPMPGYTHLQAAQVITPGFYLAALSRQALHSADRLLRTYDGIDSCPLGAGAMSGQELAWDLPGMAALLGFQRPCQHALAAVADRGWAAELTAELSLAGTALSRFVTDLMAWGSQQYGFIELPDELAGISSAMPQKKNYPVLERIRGMSAHLAGFHVDVTLAQRSTPFANMVEVSKEAGRHVATAATTATTMLRLLTAVLDAVEFAPDRMRDACAGEFMGGFTLANRMTLLDRIPWRTAQVVAGSYIVAMSARGLPPQATDPAALADIAARRGHLIEDPERTLVGVFDVDAALREKRTPASTELSAVTDMLDQQEAAHDALAGRSAVHAARVADALRRLGDLTDTR